MTSFLTERLQQRIPGLNVCGTENPALSLEKDEQIVVCGNVA